MSSRGATPTLAADVALLERAVGYLLGALGSASPAAMSRPTPCRAWDLAGLLLHLEDSLGVLREAADVGVVVLQPSYAGPSLGSGHTLRRVRASAHEALGAWLRAEDTLPTEVGDRAMAPNLVAAAGALEIAVHAWDVGAACGAPQPVPEALAEELLPIAHRLVTPAERPLLFAPAVAVPSGATRGESLIAFLGRAPDHP